MAVNDLNLNTLTFLILICGTLLLCFVQLVGESERLRMKKLEELSKNIDSMQ